MERGRRDLEPEAHHEKPETDQKQAAGGQSEPLDVRGNRGEIRGPGGTVDQRDPVKEKRGGEGAQQEVFDRAPSAERSRRRLMPTST